MSLLTIPGTSIELEITTATIDFVAQGLVDSLCLLADGQVGAAASDDAVAENILVNAHDLLQLPAPVDHKAALAARAEKAAAKDEGADGRPVSEHSGHCIGVGHAHSRAAEAMDAYTLILKAAANVLIEVVFLEISMFKLRISSLEHRFHRIFVVHACENNLDENPETIAACS